MYKSTNSITRINKTISPTFSTHNGLQQGALSSPILFNYYINDLIDELNKIEKGANINNLKITNLLFADDIVLTTRDKQTLQRLLDVCTNWANKWKLQFSHKKSKILASTTTKPEPMKLQGDFIGTTQKREYKYLGIPITTDGIAVTSYYHTIKTNMKAASYAMSSYCAEKQINFITFFTTNVQKMCQNRVIL